MAWCWKAGTSYTPTVTGGFSAPSASINTDAGFGIYKVTGSNSQSSFTTGLNEQADFIICKNLDNTYNWGVYHRSDAGDAPSAGFLHLDNDSIPSDKASTIWYQTGTTIEVNSYAETGSNGDYIYYVWHDVPGLQKFGEYVGNGSNDGPFVHLGFRPALVWIKRYSVSTGNWRIFDNLRNEADRGIGNNPIDAGMNIEAVVEAYTSPDLDIDFLSDGFKIRNNSTDNNISGSGYIYCAWAEAPSIDLYGGGANAR